MDLRARTHKAQEMPGTNEPGLELNGVLSGHDVLKIGPRARERDSRVRLTVSTLNLQARGLSVN